MKKSIAILVAMLTVLLLFSACNTPEPVQVEIPSLVYEDSTKSYRVAEQYNPNILFGEKTKDYESKYGLYHFDADVAETERDKCVYYSDQMLSRLGLEEKPEILAMADYEGAWKDGDFFYIGVGDFASADYGARLITLACGGYANFGTAYGYAAYILGQEPNEPPALTDSPARDLNWLCFREEFVSAEEIETNKSAACAFVWDCIAENGEAAFVELLKQSGAPETVAAFNTVLSGWYAKNGLEYAPSEVLYGIGGEHHDYLVLHTYATMYMAKTWKNGWPTQDETFLHESYETVKYFFELSAMQMETLQAELGFDVEYAPITVEFLAEPGISKAYPYHAEMDIGSVEDLCHEYTHYLNSRHMRKGYTQYQWLDEDLTEYLAIHVPNPYYFELLEYAKENGFKTEASLKSDYDEVYKAATAGVEDPLELWRIRWDLYAYYFADYDLTMSWSNSYGLHSFPAYLIDTLGYETLYNYGYQTDEEPAELDLEQLRKDWIAYLEETYGEYPQFSDYQQE